MKRPTVLIIGCGSIGQRHLRCFLKTDRVSVVACDSDEAVLADIKERYQVSTATDWQGAVKGDCFAAVIATPAHLHVAMARETLRYGRHVLIEKPLSQSTEGLAELLRASAASDRQSAVAYVYHVFPFLEQAGAYLANGELGPVKQAVVTSGSPFHLLRPSYAQSYYRDHATGGGAVQDGMTHIANWVESVLGPTDTVLCDSAHQALPDVEVEDTVHLMARHADVLVSYAFNQFQAPQENSIQFNATRGSVRIELHRQRWGVFRAGEKEWTWHPGTSAQRDDHFTNQAHAFLDQIEGKPPRLCSLPAAEQTLRFNLAALASAQLGRCISCRTLEQVG